MCLSVCVCVRAQKEIWSRLRMIGPFHEGLCCRWLSAVLGLALIPPALVSDPIVIHLWYMWGEQLRASESAASPRLQLVLGAKIKPATGRPVTPGCSYSQLWVIELDLVFRVLMTLITGSEEVLALLNLKAVLLFPQSASLRKCVYLLRL